MSKDKREGWLRDLKVGDEVACHTRYHGWTICKVEKITPTGMIDVDGKRFTHCGHKKGSSSWDLGITLKPLTDEIKRKAIRKELLYKLNKVNFDVLSNEQLMKIVQIIGI